MIEGIIFDLDGVLIESEPLYKIIENEVLKPYGIRISDDTSAKYMGLKLNHYLEVISKEYKKPIDVQKANDAILSKIEALYLAGTIPLVANAKQILEDLAGSYKLALATSREKRLAKIIMEKHKIYKYFSQGVYREDVKNGKPDPEVFIKAAEKINVQPKDCLVVEDSINGMKAGKAAGMYVVARETSYNQSQDLSIADSIITDLKELPPLLKINLFV